ncbi:pentatricopeptide repeat-containing protein [Hibiscus syriacus]|uniref:Pentatricopeptide repeat-containing protein n=1 Tax=Hibiscus syriacus TaxID=106335 RepID=A0A6A2XZC9_HIBSY|nr:pentatricopeptide repeat-containing protein [Hibiscus syriacus]
MRLLEKNRSKIAITTDMWTSSNQKKGFMSITLHLIDDNWEMQSRIMRFIYVPCPHTAEVLVDVLYESLYKNCIKWSEDRDEVIKAMGERMLVKFDTYWSVIHGVMGVAVVLDPRYKFKMMEYAFPKIYGFEKSDVEIVKLKVLVSRLFQDYETCNYESSRNQDVDSSRNTSDMEVQVEGEFFNDYFTFIEDDNHTGIMLELDHYLQEKGYKTRGKGENYPESSSPASSSPRFEKSKEQYGARPVSSPYQMSDQKRATWVLIRVFAIGNHITWFLRELKSAVSTSSQLTFVADFQNGLKRALADVFDKCYHSYCLRHLADKLNRYLKGQFSHEAIRFMINDFYTDAHSPRLEGFQRAAESIKCISPEAYDWVIQSEPEHWANAFFGGARYNHMISSFGQEFYSWVSEAHEFPITQMIDVLRSKMMESIYKRRVDSSQWMTKLTPSNEEKLQKETAMARSLQVLLTHDSIFEVRGECAEGTSPYEYCSRYFTTESFHLTYAESIHPVPNIDRPIEDESLEVAVTVTPPPTKRPPGRPKKKQESIDLIKRQLRCSKCKGLGHNKKTCKEP